MPTASTRSPPRERISPHNRLISGGQSHSNHSLLFTMAPASKHVQMEHVRGIDITHAELKWSPEMQRCPAPPCKYTQLKILSTKTECKTPRETLMESQKNVMHNRRAFRGSNFAKANLLADTDPFDKAAEIRLCKVLHKKTQCHNQRNKVITSPPIKRHRHEVIQTEKCLEELVQRPPEFSVDTQTDLFLERPPTPPYVSAKVGKDSCTEKPKILVDTCVEESSHVHEVEHELKIDELRKKQKEFLAIREAEFANLRRLEANEMRLLAEKERCLRQDSVAKKQHEKMQKGVLAAKLLQGHIAGLLPEVLKNLETTTNAAKKEELMKAICPQLKQEVAEKIGQNVDSRETLAVIIQEIMKQRAAVYTAYKEE